MSSAYSTQDLYDYDHHIYNNSMEEMISGFRGLRGPFITYLNEYERITLQYSRNPNSQFLIEYITRLQNAMFAAVRT
jgi:hypothetical protein